MKWERALALTLYEFRDEAPVMGSVDCCQFVAEYWQKLKPEFQVPEAIAYATQEEAEALVRQSDGFANLLSSVVGRAPDGAMEPGSLVTVDIGEDSWAAGVFNGEYVWMIHPEQGLFRARKERIEDAWRPE